MDPNYCIRRVSRWSWYSRAKSHKKVIPFLKSSTISKNASCTLTAHSPEWETKNLIMIVIFQKWYKNVFRTIVAILRIANFGEL